MNDTIRMIFQVRQSFHNFGIDITIGAKSIDGKMAVAAPIEMKEIAPGGVAPATISMPTESARELMDAMWNAGVRPSNGEGNIGQIGAMREHLEDMRRLVFKK